MFRSMDNKEKLAKLAKLIGSEDAKQLSELIKNEKGKPPKIAILGKAGVGKTTTINNLFNAQWKVSHTVTGTSRVFQKEFELVGGGILNIYDMPGLGDDIESDKIYEEMYAEILPQVDVALWVIQANARDLAEDQRLIKDVINKSIKQKSKLVIGLNQVDKLQPGEWDKKLNMPSSEQEKTIKERCKDISKKLSLLTEISEDKIVYYSAERRFKLYDLLTALITSAGDLGWKLPINPKNPFELADIEVQEFVNQFKNNRK